MDPNRAFIVICLTLAAVTLVNLAIFSALRRGRSNDLSQIDLARRAMRSINQPWKNEDDALKELARRVAALKPKSDEGGDRPHE